MNAAPKDFFRSRNSGKKSPATPAGAGRPYDRRPTALPFSLSCILAVFLLLPAPLLAASAEMRNLRTGPGVSALSAVKNRAAGFNDTLALRALEATFVNVALHFGCKRPAYLEEGQEPPPPPTPLGTVWNYITDEDRNVSLWGGYSADWAKQSSGNGAVGYSFDPQSVTIGIDTSLRGVTLGTAFSWYGGKVNNRADGTNRNDIDGWMAGVYALAPVANDTLFCTASFWGGQAGNDTRYTFVNLGGRTSGSFDTRHMGASLDVHGLILPNIPGKSALVLFPHAGIAWQTLRADGYSESGPAAFARDLGRARWESWEMPVGIRASGYLGDVPVMPVLDLAYVRTLGESAPYQDITSAAFGPDARNSALPRQGRDAFRLTAALASGVPLFSMDRMLSIDIGYTLEVREHYRDNGLRANLGFYF